VSFEERLDSERRSDLSDDFHGMQREEKEGMAVAGRGSLRGRESGRAE
jgi:hypothetical protein